MVGVIMVEWVLKSSLLAAQVVHRVHAETVEYVTEYEGAPLPEGKKSVSFRIVASAPDRALSSEEINALRTRIVEGLNLAGYGLRV